jgi:acetyl esterase/lipase
MLGATPRGLTFVQRRRLVLAVAMALAVAACASVWRRGPYHGTTERIAYGPAPSNVAELRVPAGPGPHPVVVLLHGGYYQRRYGADYFVPLAEALTTEGFATWNVEYRRLGEDGGGYPGTFRDVADATNLLARLAPSRKLDLSRVTALGHSAGGQLALWLASQSRYDFAETYAPVRIARVVALAPVTDLRGIAEANKGMVREIMGGTPSERPTRYAELSPLELLPLGVPQVVIHGTDDWLLPFAASERYVAAARAAGDDVTLVPIPGMGHLAVADPSSAVWPNLLAAVRGDAQPAGDSRS